VIADIESIITTYLKAETGERIVGETPSDLNVPWVKLTLLDAANESASNPEHLIEYMVQAECYAGAEKAGAQGEAFALVSEVRAALANLEGIHGGAVFSCVRFSGMARVPDTKLEPARQRYILTSHLYAH